MMFPSFFLIFENLSSFFFKFSKSPKFVKFLFEINKENWSDVYQCKIDIFLVKISATPVFKNIGI